MDSKRSTKIKCRFCGLVSPGMRSARDHMNSDHPGEMPKIREKLPAEPSGERRFVGGLGAGLGTEFRKRMGYGPKDG
jgi:hypothetical protein